MPSVSSLFVGALLCLAPFTATAASIPRDVEERGLSLNPRHLQLEARLDRTTQIKNPPRVTASKGTTSAATAWKQDILAAHNAARSTHGANALTWSSDAASLAASWAAKCVWEHGGASGYGQNLYATASTATITSVPGKQAVDSWMSEEAQYDFSKPGFSSATGHFTQVVWKSSTQVGCAYHICTNLKDGSGNLVFPAQFKSQAIVVCNYSPPGNYLGQFPQNVQKGA